MGQVGVLAAATPLSITAGDSVPGGGTASLAARAISGAGEEAVVCGRLVWVRWSWLPVAVDGMTGVERGGGGGGCLARWMVG